VDGFKPVDNHSRYLRASDVSLSPFYGFSSTLKSLRICLILLPFPQVFDLIFSFPLLEDLTLVACDESRFDNGSPRGPQTVVPSTSPVFTGSLDLHIQGGAGNVARRLLDLPNGLHFRKLALSCSHVEDLWWIRELVARCSHALQSIDIKYSFCSYTHPYLVCTNNLILLSSRVGVALVRHLESNETPRCGFSTRNAEHRMDHHGTQNHHT